MNAVQAIIALAQDGNSSSRTDSQLEKELKQILENYSPEELGRIAVFCYLIAYPGDAGDIGFDKPFDRACWQCISTLSKHPTPENQQALSFIGRYARFNGGDKMAFDELMEKFDRSLKHPVETNPVQ